MSDEEKIQRCLRLIVVRLFYLELRFQGMKVLHSSENQKGLEDGLKDILDNDGDEVLQQFFRGLRRQAGVIVDEVPSDLSSASPDDVWSALRHAERQEADAQFLDREWKAFWDAL